MNNLYKDLKTAITIVVVISIVTLFLHYFITGTITWDSYKRNLFYNVYYGIPLSFFNGWFFDYLSKKIPWDQYPVKRAYAGSFGFCHGNYAKPDRFEFHSYGRLSKAGK